MVSRQHLMGSGCEVLARRTVALAAVRIVHLSLTSPTYLAP